MFSGGAFGAEGSVLSVVVLTTLAAVVAVLLVRQRAAVPPMWVRIARQRPA